MKVFPPHQIDFYKSGHIKMNPDNTELVFSNMTPRTSRLPEINKVVFFSLQYFIKEYLVKQWKEDFFDVDIDVVIALYEDRMNKALGDGVVSSDHIRDLHELGYLPLEIMALEEGTHVPLKVPMFVLFNTHKRFGWITNYLETIISTTVWGGCTSATVANEYRNILSSWADKTGAAKSFIPFQAHDFSCRGVLGFEGACISGAAHLTSFVGTDTVGSIDFLEKYYGANWGEGIVGCSVPATEHSVMSLGDEGNEKDTFERLISTLYPGGIISIVSDTWDFFKVISEYIPSLKDVIMARNGKVVIRPDSGDPADILCGVEFNYIEDRHAGSYASYKREMDNLNLPVQILEVEYKGAVQCLWETFGGTTTDKGYKVLDEHIGLIYGDSITRERCKDICERLEKKGFASSNVVFGVGSYTYQYVTRDTFGFAVKATYAEVDGKPKEIFKKPKTDDGTKNSAKGLTAVFKDENGELYLKDQATWDDVYNCEFKTVFRDGGTANEISLTKIRENVMKG
jgi:nicotinamide phosphoribosyltransferase